MNTKARSSCTTSARIIRVHGSTFTAVFRGPTGLTPCTTIYTGYRYAAPLYKMVCFHCGEWRDAGSDLGRARSELRAHRRGAHVLGPDARIPTPLYTLNKTARPDYPTSSRQKLDLALAERYLLDETLVHLDLRITATRDNHRGRCTIKWAGKWVAIIAAEVAVRGLGCPLCGGRLGTVHSLANGSLLDRPLRWCSHCKVIPPSVQPPGFAAE